MAADHSKIVRVDRYCTCYSIIGPAGRGLAFTRWGKTTCTRTEGMELIYEGVVVGSPYNEAGTAEYLCLYRQPQFLRTTAGLQQGRGRLYGTSYEARDNPPAFGSVEHHETPCAVCYTARRNTKITIPARTPCPSSWTRDSEYYGYLMAAVQYSNQKSKVPLVLQTHTLLDMSGSQNCISLRLSALELVVPRSSMEQK